MHPFSIRKCGTSVFWESQFFGYIQYITTVQIKIFGYMHDERDIFCELIRSDTYYFREILCILVIYFIQAGDLKLHLYSPIPIGTELFESIFICLVSITYMSCPHKTSYEHHYSYTYDEKAPPSKDKEGKQEDNPTKNYQRVARITKDICHHNRCQKCKTTNAKYESVCECRHVQAEW